MEGGHHHHHHHHQQHQQQHQQHQISTTVSVDSDRFPQWSIQETKEFLMIRAELDRTFMETKRNKLLWEVISNKMKEKGFHRSSEQCKCKWKNLVTRYKGCETMEPESLRQQFPFYNELQAIFAARMQRMLWAEAEGAAGGGSKTKAGVQLSSEEEDENEESEGEKSSVRKRKKGKMNANSSGNSNSNNLKEILEEFMKQQIQMEMQWREAFEMRENERKMREMEWRQKMEALENERIMMDRRWREREEQRRIREEARAEKRDLLITALLNKLTRQDM
ncbi:trihelix transcription factor GT-3b [Mercurialis annua]|uniref:trihelix transcription factor GT-3b n=1 Tax=Mercurialis annua TaxID=3986 RepID=UPI00216015CA|nr:trihelix transcription factor GT-3b [Mercurialis annua]